jgi:hypothetical protein
LGGPEHQDGVVALRASASFRSTIVRIASRTALGVLVVEAIWILWTIAGGDPRFPVGCDFAALREAARRWLGGDAFYPPFELAGPFWQLNPGSAVPVIMYPPVGLLLFAPFTVLPAAAWWLIPAAIVVLAVRRLHPPAWVWPPVLLLALCPYVPEAIQNGNPVIWMFAFAMAGAAFGWFGPLVLLKPTLAPFALLGVRRRSWWISATVILIVCVPFGALWIDYARVIANVRASPGWFLHDWPFLGIAALIYLGSRSERVAWELDNLGAAVRARFPTG